MEIIGRITADAVINTTKDKRSVVNFSVAVNDTYRNREGDKVKLTEYYRCAYWLSDKIATWLTKGVLVELSGWVSQNVWKDSDGEPRASLNFHTQHIRLHGSTAKSINDKKENAKPTPEKSIVENDNLPF